MKKLLSYILIIQFWLMPFGSINIAHAAAETAATCAAQGKVFQGGRCVESANVSTSRAATTGCMAIEDPEQQKECYAQTAQDSLNTTVNDGDAEDREGEVKKQPIIYNIATISSIVLAMVLIGVKKYSKNNPQAQGCKNMMSIKLMLAGSLAAVASEIAGNVHFKSKVRKALKDYKEDVAIVGEEQSNKFKTSKSDGEIGKEAQSTAFDYLIEKEKAFKAAATIKAAGYVTAAALFGAGGVYSVLEKSQVEAAKKIGSDPSPYYCNIPQDVKKKTDAEMKAAASGADNSKLSTEEMNNIQNSSDGSSVSTSDSINDDQPLDFNAASSVGGLGGGLGSSETTGTNGSNQPQTTGIPEGTTFDNQTDIYGEQMENLHEEGMHKNDLDDLYDFQAPTPNGSGGGRASLEINLNNSLEEIEVPSNVDKDEVRIMMDVFITMANNILMGNAYAQSYGGGKETIDEDANVGKDIWEEIKGLLMAAAGSFMVMMAMKKMINKGLARPIVRIGFAAAMGGYAGYVSSEHFKEIEVAKKRIEVLEDLKSKIEEATSGNSSCPVDEPDCNVRSGNDPNGVDARDATNYDPVFEDSGNPKYCLDKTNRLDPKCKCRKKKSCKKIVGGMALPGIGQTSWLKGLSAGANGMMSGSLGNAGKLDGITKSANTALKKLNALKKKMRKSKKYGPFMKRGKKFEKQITKGLGNIVKRGIANGTIKPGSTMSSGNLPTTPQGALATIKKDIAKARKVEKAKMRGGKGGGSSAVTGDDELDFGFGGDEEMGGVFEEDEDIMDKDFEYAENDIYPNKDESIFKVLSSRYHRSGLKRLFDSENKYKADEASDTEIHGSQ